MSEPLCLPEHGSTHGGTVDINGALGDAFSTTTASNKEKDDAHDITAPTDTSGDNVNVGFPNDITSQTKDDSASSLNDGTKDDDTPKDDGTKNDDPKDISDNDMDYPSRLADKYWGDGYYIDESDDDSNRAKKCDPKDKDTKDDDPEDVDVVSKAGYRPTLSKADVSSNVSKDKDSSGTTSPQRVVRKVNRDKLRAKVSDDSTASTDKTSTTSTGKRTRDDQADNKVKVDALRKLWLNADVAAFFKFSGVPHPAFDEDKAEKAVERYIDYFQGRMIKADFSRFVEGDISIFGAYDRDFGQGKAKKALGW